jgi:nitrogen regulatory protein P-II 1
MKRIEAIIKPGKLDELKDRLRQAGAQGITVSEVRGFGRTGGRKDAYLGSASDVDFIPKVRIQMVIDDDMAQPIVEAIQATACTGEIGDGKIFVSHVLDAIRIRTGERGHDALSDLIRMIARKTSKRREQRELDNARFKRRSSR